MSHFKPHPIPLFCVFYMDKICLNQVTLLAGVVIKDTVIVICSLATTCLLCKTQHPREIMGHLGDRLKLYSVSSFPPLHSIIQYKYLSWRGLSAANLFLCILYLN